MSKLYLALMNGVDTPELLKTAAAEYGVELTEKDAEEMFAKLLNLRENPDVVALSDADLERVAGGKGEDPELNPKTYIGKRVVITSDSSPYKGKFGTIINAWRIYLCGDPWIKVRIKLDNIGVELDYEKRYCFFHIL